MDFRANILLPAISSHIATKPSNNNNSITVTPFDYDLFNNTSSSYNHADNFITNNNDKTCNIENKLSNTDSISNSRPSTNNSSNNNYSRPISTDNNSRPNTNTKRRRGKKSLQNVMDIDASASIDQFEVFLLSTLPLSLSSNV